jgi:CRP-like cAMP-binding protein
MKEELKKYLNKIHPIPDTLMNEFLERWIVKTAHKKEIITEINTIDRYLYFIAKGAQKAYYLTDGNEYIIAFSHPYTFTCIPESFLTQKPSNYCWQCVTESEFLQISHRQFFDFIEKHSEFETLLWKNLIGTLGGLVNRYHRLLAFSMEERFRDLMKNSPHLLNLVPQKDIANYLKIDPTNFSKLINRIRI